MKKPTVKTTKLPPHVIDECAAHGKLAALMVDHSDEIRFLLDYMWVGFMKRNCEAGPEEGAESCRLAEQSRRRYQRIHDRVARFHRDLLLKGDRR